MEQEIHNALASNYGLSGTLEPLAGYEDLNFRLSTSTGEFVVKISKPGQEDNIAMQCKVMDVLASSSVAKLIPGQIRSIDGNAYERVQLSGENRLVRVIPWLKGDLLAHSARSPELFRHFGSVLGEIDRNLQEANLWHARKDPYEWDLQMAHHSLRYLRFIEDAAVRRITHYFLARFEELCLPAFIDLPKSVIHSDANDYNVVIQDSKVSGVFDFGDAVYAPRICEIAIALAYGLMGQDEIIELAEAMVSGYHGSLPMKPEEIDILYYLIAARLAVTIAKAAHARHQNPENAYLLVSEAPARTLIQKWVEINPIHFTSRMRQRLGMETGQVDADRQDRDRYVNPSLSIAYSEPIEMKGAAFQYMYAADGTTYLDCVNNICHVGHCHPDVARAGSRQMAQLNTNTRYVYDSLNRYSKHLAGKFPDPLEVVYLVNSGSEAGDLAQRIARTITGKRAVAVVDHAYHGNTLAGIEVSPYKYKSRGGTGKAPHVMELPSPSTYSDLEISKSEEELAHAIDQQGEIAALYCESIVGCGGQVVLPEGYLKGMYRVTRDAGGLCIADEVQVGFGRVGETFWAFELQGVVPDIVVIGKPMGNGHPMAAVVTTRPIADAFDNGMEYFSSFGGNPVSCEIGNAVLRVIENEKLQQHAKEVGEYFKSRLADLARSHPIISDVRGHGLFLGVELTAERAPATQLTRELIEYMKSQGILLSSDGPDNNVLKIKPPMTFNRSNVDTVIAGIDAFLKSI